MFRLIPAYFSGTLVLLLFSGNGFDWQNGLRALLLLGMALIISFWLEHRQSGHWPHWTDSLSVVLVFCVGMVFTLVQSYGVTSTRWQDAVSGPVPVVLEGEVVSLPERNEKYTRFVFRVRLMPPVGSSSTHLGDFSSAPETLRLTHFLQSAARVQVLWFEPELIPELGDTLRLKLSLKEPRTTFNPGTYDGEKKLFIERIRAEGSVTKSPDNMLLAKAGKFSVAYWRQTVWNRLSGIPGDPDARAVLAALVVGEKSSLSYAAKDLFSRMGISHLIAISGLHIGLIAGWVILITRWAWSRTGICARYIAPVYSAVVVGLLAGVVYALLAGFTVPTQRALLMLSIGLLAMLSKRVIAPLNVFLVALAVVITLDPLAVLGAGFWLSFGAVAIIYLTLCRCAHRPAWYRAIMVQAGIFFIMFPLQLLFFGEASLISPLINAVAIPLFSILVVPAALLVTLLLFVLPTMGVLLGQLWLEGVERWIALLGWIDQRISTRIAISGVPDEVLLLLLIGLMICLVLHTWRGRVWVLVALALVLPWFWVDWQRLPHGDVAVQVLDVGQGLSVIVRTRHHVMIYDTGPHYGKQVTQAERIVMPILEKARIRRLNTLIVSHSHDDHSAGLAALQRRVVIDRILSGEPRALGAEGVELCTAGQTWIWDGVRFDLLHPEEGHHWEGNSASCVLRVSVGEYAVLLTGDIEADAEKQLLRANAPDIQSDILVVPHHGSRSSSMAPFIQQVAPQHAIIPVGYRNRYRLPAPSVVRRYQESDICVWNTALDGAVEFHISSKGVNRLFSSRQKYGKIWTLVRKNQWIDCF